MFKLLLFIAEFEKDTTTYPVQYASLINEEGKEVWNCKSLKTYRPDDRYKLGEIHLEHEIDFDKFTPARTIGRDWRRTNHS